MIRCLFLINYKDIRSLYLIFAFIAGLIGTMLSVLIRIELSDIAFAILEGNHQNLLNILINCIKYSSKINNLIMYIIKNSRLFR